MSGNNNNMFASLEAAEADGWMTVDNTKKPKKNTKEEVENNDEIKNEIEDDVDAESEDEAGAENKAVAAAAAAVAEDDDDDVLSTVDEKSGKTSDNKTAPVDEETTIGKVTFQGAFLQIRKKNLGYVIWRGEEDASFRKLKDVMEKLFDKENPNSFFPVVGILQKLGIWDKKIDFKKVRIDSVDIDRAEVKVVLATQVQIMAEFAFRLKHLSKKYKNLESLAEWSQKCFEKISRFTPNAKKMQGVPTLENLEHSDEDAPDTLMSCRIGDLFDRLAKNADFIERYDAGNNMDGLKAIFKQIYDENNKLSIDDIWDNIPEEIDDFDPSSVKNTDLTVASLAIERLHSAVQDKVLKAMVVRLQQYAKSHTCPKDKFDNLNSAIDRLSTILKMVEEEVKKSRERKFNQRKMTDAEKDAEEEKERRRKAKYADIARHRAAMNSLTSPQPSKAAAVPPPIVPNARRWEAGKSTEKPIAPKELFPALPPPAKPVVALKSDVKPAQQETKVEIKKVDKKVSKKAAESESEDEAPVKKTKKPTKKSVKKAVESDSDEESEDEAPVKKTKKPTKKPVKKAVESDSDEESEDEKPVKKTKKPIKKTKKPVDSDEESEEDEKPKSKKHRESDSDDESEDESEDEAPKKKKSSKVSKAQVVKTKGGKFLIVGGEAILIA